MSLIFAWKGDNAISLVTDSTFTTSGMEQIIQKGIGPPTSLSEEKVITESRLRMFNIRNRVIAAMAGDYETGIRVIRKFELLLEKYPNARVALEKAVKFYEPYTPDTSIGLIVGYFYQNTPRLVSYNADYKREFQEHTGFIQMGTMRGDTPMLMKLFMEYIDREKLNVREKIVAVSSFLQSFGIQDTLFNVSAGGAFFGLQVNAQGVLWQEDTAYVVHRPDLGIVNIVTAIARQNILFLRSLAHLKQDAFISNINLSTNPMEDILSGHREVEELFESGGPEYCAFINQAQRVLGIVHNHRNIDNEYFTIDPFLIAKLQIKISERFQEILSERSPLPGEERFPFILKWLECTEPLRGFSDQR